MKMVNMFTYLYIRDRKYSVDINIIKYKITMPKATGSIHYIEHRSPMKDETGEYLIHPQFVYSDIYDFKDMTKGMRHHHQMTPAQFVAAIESIKDETMLALSQGMEVKIGNMLVIRPKLKLREHKDENGNYYHKVYHDGERIPASEVVCSGFEVRTTKEFDKDFFIEYDSKCSRSPWKTKAFAQDPEEEWQIITNYCKEHGFITVKNFRLLLGVADYHARQVLDGYCEGDFPKMIREKVGATYLYRVIGE